MQDNNLSKFKIRIDEESPDSLLKPNRENIRAKKLNQETLNQKINIVSILILCLIVVVSFLAFYDINRKFGKLHNTGTLNIKNISRDLESRFSSLSVKQAKLEDSFSKKLLSIEKTVSGLKERFEKTEKSVNRIKSTKIDKNKLANVIADVDKKIIPLRKNFKDFLSQTKTLEKEVKQKLSGLSKSINNNIKTLEKLKGRISSASSEMIDKKTLAAELKKGKESYNQELDKIKKELQKKVASINSKLNRLEDKLFVSGQYESKTKKQVSDLKPGTIIEQDIQE